MKKNMFLIVFLIIFIIFIVYRVIYINFESRTDNKQSDELIIYYDNNIYDKILNWWPTGNINKKDKAWFGYSTEIPEFDKVKNNSKIWLYDNDPENRFIIKNYKSWLLDERLFHKKDDELPKPYYENAEIILKLDEKRYIIVVEEILNEFKQFIEICLTNSEEVLKVDSMQKGLATIKVIYEDYPAWQYFAWLGTYEEKIIMLPITRTDQYIYYVLPDNLANQIKPLLKI